MTTHAPTAEQAAIIAAARDTTHSIVIDAKAGSGKTDTLKRIVPLLKGSIAVLAFNRAIADELKAKIEPTLSFQQRITCDISTAHAAGLRAFTRNGRKPKTLGGKLSFLLRDIGKSVPSDDDFHRNTRHISKLTSHAKNAGFGLRSSGQVFPAIDDEPSWHALIDHFDMGLELEGDFSEDELVEHAQRLLMASNARLDSIDFDDMIYLPLLLGLAIPQYDNVLVDEAQDINATRRELLFRMKTPRGRIIAVGDPNQAIYGFTGADIASLERIRDRASASVFPLTTCWRCDASIIASAQEQVPAIKARPGAAAGVVKRVFWEEKTGPDGALDFLAMPLPGDAILCRLNKPNVAVALGLIRRGTPARIEGRDIGAKLLDHIKRAEPLYASTPMIDVLPALDQYLEIETHKLMTKKRETAIAMLEDEVDAAKLLIERTVEAHGPGNGSDLNGAEFRHVEALANDLFGDNINSANLVTLSSIHKSKGREWPRVFILGYTDYMPFHIAQRLGGWQLTQEHNLIYVAKTRAMNNLVMVNGVQSAIDRGLHRQAPRQS